MKRSSLLTRKDQTMMFETIELASREGERGAGGGPRILFPLLFLLLAGLLIGKAIRRRKYGMHHAGHGSAMRTLQDRFARGEIDQREYDHRKAVLDGADVVPPAPTSAAPPAPTVEGDTAPAPDAPDASDEGK